MHASSESSVRRSPGSDHSTDSFRKNSPTPSKLSHTEVREALEATGKRKLNAADQSAATEQGSSDGTTIEFL